MPRVKKNVNTNQILEMDKKVKRKKPLQTLKGMRDLLPSEQKYWDFVLNEIRSLSTLYNYGKIEVPIMESTDLFVRSIGKETDVVSKEMYSFMDQGKEKITLRPELTASVVRAYIQHGMPNLPQPVKLYYDGPVFRHDNPQSGRYRQFYQAGFEVIGENGPAVDVQLLVLGARFFENLHLDVELHLNSMGCPECREEYRKTLIKYYKPLRNKVCKTCKIRLTKNPLRLLDCKERQCQIYAETAPKMVDHLCETCRVHFEKIKEYLDDLKVSYVLDHTLVRGLDYYTRTVFEYVAGAKQGKRQNALGGGGRYDLLVEQLGGRPTPAAGFAIGLDRVILALKEMNFKIADDYKVDVFIAQIGDIARRKAMKIFEDLHKKGIKVAEHFVKDSLKAQLEYANRLGVKLVLILGQQEVMDNTVLLRDMEGGVQETIAIDKLAAKLKDKVKQYK